MSRRGSMETCPPRAMDFPSATSCSSLSPQHAPPSPLSKSAAAAALEANVSGAPVWGTPQGCFVCGTLRVVRIVGMVAAVGGSVAAPLLLWMMCVSVLSVSARGARDVPEMEGGVMRCQEESSWPSLLLRGCWRPCTCKSAKRTESSVLIRHYFQTPTTTSRGGVVSRGCCKGDSWLAEHSTRTEVVGIDGFTANSLNGQSKEHGAG